MQIAEKAFDISHFAFKPTARRTRPNISVVAIWLDHGLVVAMNGPVAVAVSSCEDPDTMLSAMKESPPILVAPEHWASIFKGWRAGTKLTLEQEETSLLVTSSHTSTALTTRTTIAMVTDVEFPDIAYIWRRALASAHFKGKVHFKVQTLTQVLKWMAVKAGRRNKNPVEVSLLSYPSDGTSHIEQLLTERIHARALVMPYLP